MMVRTQIALESELHLSARTRARALGISLAEYLRRLVARDLRRPQQTAQVQAVFDLGASGQADIATQKRAMIAEAFAAAAGGGARQPPPRRAGARRAGAAAGRPWAGSRTRR